MIEAKYNIDELIRKAAEEAESVIADIILAMQLSCEEVVKMARDLPSPPATLREQPHQPNYIDDTAYLRSSIGFALYNNGQLVAEQYQPSGSGDRAAGGPGSAKKTADGVAAKFPDGIVAVIVAGAEYAAAVESKGYDVLTGSTKELQRIFKGYINDVKAVHGL